MGCITYHGVHAEAADQIGGRLPAEQVVEPRAVERVAGVQVDDGRWRAVRGRQGPLGVQRAEQPGETTAAAGHAARAVVAAAAGFVVVRVQVVGVQNGQPEHARSSRSRSRHRSSHLKQSQRHGRDHRTAQCGSAVDRYQCSRLRRGDNGIGFVISATAVITNLDSLRASAARFLPRRVVIV